MRPSLASEAISLLGYGLSFTASLTWNVRSWQSVPTYYTVLQTLKGRSTSVAKNAVRRTVWTALSASHKGRASATELSARNEEDGYEKEKNGHLGILPTPTCPTRPAHRPSQAAAGTKKDNGRGWTIGSPYEHAMWTVTWRGT